MSQLEPNPVTPATPVRPALLGNREFALLFGGQAVSALGDRLVMVAMPFAVLAIPGAGLTDVGLVLGASALTLALFVLVGGVYADRLPRHLTMLGSDAVRALAQGASAALLISGHASVLSLAALQAVYGAAEAFFRPAVLGLVPQLVERSELQPANALLALSNNTAMIIGPAFAGLLVGAFGAGAAIAVDAATFLVSGITLAFLRPRPVRRGAGTTKPRFLDELGDGWQEVRSRSWVWSIILAFSAYHALVLPALFVFGPLVSEQSRGGAGAWGLITAGFGAGAVLGSMVALRWRPARPGIVIGLALCLSSTQAAIVVSAAATWVVTVLEFLTGVTVAVCFTVWETCLQQHVDEDAQSRVSSFDYLGSLALMPLGFLAMSPLGEAIGIGRAAVVASCVGLVVSAAVAASPAVRSLVPARPNSEQ